MADILIVHAAADSSAAEDLAATLRAAGHEARLLGPQDRIDPRRYDFMVWLVSAASLEARHVYSQIFIVMDVDRISHSLRKLLPVFIDEEARARLSAQMADLGDWTLFDFVDLAPLLSHIARHDDCDVMADIGYEPDSDEDRSDSLDPTTAADDASDPGISGGRDIVLGATRGGSSPIDVLKGRLVHRIPSTMRIATPTVVEVRFGEAGTVGLTHGLAGGGVLVQEDLAMVETMTVELVAPGGAFVIEAQTPATQLVSGDVLAGTALTQARHGRWLWLVTPKAAGAHDLVVRVAAVIADSRSIPASVLLPERSFTIRVRVSYGAMGWSPAWSAQPRPTGGGQRSRHGWRGCARTASRMAGG